MSDTTDTPLPAALPAALEIITPPELEAPRGFSHGILVPAGWSTLAVAGQTAAGVGLDVAPMPFAEQFDLALAKVVQVVRAAGASVEHVTRITVYVTDLEAYRASRAALSPVWRRHMNRHYPAMTLVQVSGLVDVGAVVEIQADAVVAPRNAR